MMPWMSKAKRVGLKSTVSLCQMLSFNLQMGFLLLRSLDPCFEADAARKVSTTPFSGSGYPANDLLISVRVFLSLPAYSKQVTQLKHER